ncbi:PAT1 domain-containing protein [Pyrenophora tritici-repentis]|nr:PAT1 domain-containing protein [Pyrenophora tritici-repentis]KAI0613098.1 PAT1 domain-containing protein [Pyrenophora tritici-repentis]KAI0626033.1 PAT1 domain-containing protein [Pyrenophora tritici-repentis]
MQNYGQVLGYQRPESTASFTEQQAPLPPIPPPPPGYGAHQGYQSAAPQVHSQWAAPTPTHTSNPWNHSQQNVTGGYNPGTYGTMPGAQHPSYPPQQDQPPPPPPKPYGFAAAVQREAEKQQQNYMNTQNWPQEQQQNAGFGHHAGGYSVQGIPPPPSATPGGSQYNSVPGGRPSSIYGANLPGSYASGAPQQASIATTPNEQQSTYTPPFQSGPDVQSYGISNTNTGSGSTWVVPPPNSAWQQAHHAPPQGAVGQSTDPSFYTQGYQGTQSIHQSHQPPPLPPRPVQHPGKPQPQLQHNQAQYGAQEQFQYTPQVQFSAQQGQPPIPTAYNQTTYDQPIQQPTQYPHSQSHWQSPPQPDATLAQQNVQSSLESQQTAWQTGALSQGSFHGQQHSNVSNEEIPARTSLNRTDTAQSNVSAPDFPHHSIPQSQPVSPISNRASISTASGYEPGSRRNDSISSVALANLHAQRAENRVSSPKPASPSLPMPSAPRDDKSKFSVLAAGAPSDWEHLGQSEEVNDEALFGVKDKKDEAVQPTGFELPAHVPSPPPMHDWPSPATYFVPLASNEWNANPVPTTPQVTQEGCVVEDAIVAPLRTTPRPTQGGQHPVPESIDRNATRYTSQDHTADLNAKDDVIKQLQAELQQEREHSKIEMEIFKADKQKLDSETEASRKHTSSEMDVLREQIETMRIAADQASANSEASAKENGVTLERLKEDVEGKEQNIKERDETIAELRREVDAERARETPNPTFADLIPDLDPWYVGSLERYVAMLRGEASEPQVEEKIKIFKAFMKAESEIRGIDYFDVPPQSPTIDPEASQQQHQSTRSRGASNDSTGKPHLNVQVPQDSADEDEDDYQYSPGGRPILMQRNTLTRAEATLVHPSAPPSVQSTTILTPTSSVDDDTNKTPVQSHPEEWSPPKYKAYVPSASTSASPVALGHGHRMPISAVPSAASPSGRSSSKGQDEIFFGANQPHTQKPISRPSSRETSVPVPAPLTFSARRPLSAVYPSKLSPNEILDALLPSNTTRDIPCEQLQDLRTKLVSVGSKTNDIDAVTKSWEASASRIRRGKDDARRKREEENEENNEDLFNSNEISYAEMNELEDEFKQKEAELKAQEDKDEYESYVTSVFDPMYSELQQEILALMDLYRQVEYQLQTSASGLKSLQSDYVPSTTDCLELLKDLHEQVEKRHESVAQLIANRDKRHKKTEIQPLYVAGNISKMKIMEKRYQDAEEQAVLKAKHDKTARMIKLIDTAEDAVVEAVSADQQDTVSIVTHLREMADSTSDAAVLFRAQATIKALKASSKDLLSLFNALKVKLNNVIIDAEVAQLKYEGMNAERILKLQMDRVDNERKTAEEFERKMEDLESDEVEIGELIQMKMGKGGEKNGGGDSVQEKTGGVSEKEERMRMALEAAKRRNGDI